jgi:antibiotic biosynthesis monooxygenase (ABM) superfamily enzyme
MIVNIVHFPPIKAGKDAEFREWFAWSNEEYAKHKGFIRRRLLKPRQGGNYAAIVEHESYETFMAMHTSPTRAEAYKRVEPLFDGGPTPHFYEVVMG